MRRTLRRWSHVPGKLETRLWSAVGTRSPGPSYYLLSQRRFHGRTLRTQNRTVPTYRWLNGLLSAVMTQAVLQKTKPLAEQLRRTLGGLRSTNPPHHTLMQSTSTSSSSLTAPIALFRLPIKQQCLLIRKARLAPIPETSQRQSLPLNTQEEGKRGGDAFSGQNSQ